MVKSVKGFTCENSKGSKERSANWPARGHDTQPPRMSRSVPAGKGGGGASALPSAGHAKYGVDPGTGPVRMSRNAPGKTNAKANNRPPNDEPGYAVSGVELKANRGYGV